MPVGPRRKAGMSKRLKLHMHIKNAEKFRSQLEALLVRQSTSPVDLLIVPNIAEWAAANQCLNAQGDPPAMAVRFSTGKGGILIRQVMNSAQVRSVIDRIAWAGRHPDAYTILCTEVVFLSHLVLHELAHLTNDWGQDREDDCDDWAFARLS